MGIIGSLFDAIKGFFGDVFSGFFSLLKTLGGWILDGIALLLKPVFAILDAIFYFIWQLGALLIDVVSLVLLLARFLMGLIIGGTRTILSLAYDGRDADMGGMAGQFSWMQPFIDGLHLNVIAGIASFGVWILTYFAAQRIIANFK